MRIFICLPLLLVLNSLANATILRGPGVNNGGGGWECRTSSGEVHWIKLHDLWYRSDEIKEYQDRVLEFEDGEYQDIYKNKLAWIKENAPDLQRYLDRHPLDVFKVISLVEGPIDIIHDVSIRRKPKKTECPQGDIYFVQIANFLDPDVLFIDQRIWSSPAFSQNDKAALLLHELIYRTLRNEFGDETSWRAASIVGILFDGEMSIEEFNDYVDSIIWQWNSHSRKEVPDVFLGPFEVICKVSIKSLVQEEGATPDREALYPLSEERFNFFSFAGYEFSVSLDYFVGVPEYLSIKDLRTGKAEYITIRRPASQKESTLMLITDKEQATLICTVHGDPS